MSDVEIKVPALGESVTEATVSVWHKKPGDNVAQDELIAELETDKVSMEVTAQCAGTLDKIVAKEGSTVAVGAVLGIISAGEAAATPPAATETPAPITPQIATDEATTTTEPANTTPPSAPVSNPDTPLSPAVRKMVAENNIDVQQIQGTGKDQRVTKGDVINAISNPVSAASSCHTSSNVAGGRKEERVRMTRLRAKIAQRLKDAQNTAAILTTFNEVDMSHVMAARKKYKDMFEKKHGIKLGFMSFFIKASIAALKEIPAVNAEIDGDAIVYKNYYDIGVAVGTEQGLVVPVIRDADNLSFADIERSIAVYGQKARERQLTMADMSGGSFTISNGGVYGSLLSTPIINPPQSGILGMHKIQERPVAIEGKVEIRPMMYLALSYDHRIIDGKEAVTFLIRIKDLIEDPERLLFDV